MKLVFAVIAAVSLSANAADPQSATNPKLQTAAASVDTTAVTLAAKDPLPKTVKELTIIEREPGNQNTKPIPTRTPVLVHYTGWLYDPAKPDGKGAEFDSSLKQPVPFGFIVGAGRVIKGWDQGIVGMREKGKRTLIIPAALAYGESGAAPKIPANATLLFDVELVQVIGGAAQIK